MSTNLRNVYSQQLPWLKQYNVKSSEGRRNLAYASIFKTLFKDGSKEFTKFSSLCDKRLTDKSRQIEIDRLLTKELIETALSKPIRMNTLEQNFLAVQKNDRDQDWFTPLAIEIFELAINGDFATALAKIDELPIDYAFESRLEGQLFLLMVAINEEEWGVVEAVLAKAAVCAQMVPTEFVYQMLLGEFAREHVPKQYLPWMMRGMRTEEVGGEMYYCMPFMMSTYGILDQYRIHEREIDYKPATTPSVVNMIPKYRDRHGNVYVSGDTLIAAKITDVTMSAMNALGAAVTTAALKITQHMQKGSWSGYVGVGCLTSLKSAKSTVFPLGSCGYVISKDPSVFEQWNNSISSSHINTDKLKNYDGFFNFVDGEYYDTGKKPLPESLKSILSDIQ